MSGDLGNTLEVTDETDAITGVATVLAVEGVDPVTHVFLSTFK